MTNNILFFGDDDGGVGINFSNSDLINLHRNVLQLYFFCVSMSSSVIDVLFLLQLMKIDVNALPYSLNDILVDKYELNKFIN